jgi:hypothetical protein
MKRKLLVIAGLLGICLMGSFNRPVLAYCIERVLPESYVYYYDPEQTEWAGWCSTTAFDGCHYSCVGDITDYYQVSSNTIICEDCG